MEEKCKHNFELSQVTTESENPSAGGTSFFYKKVAYVVCTKCGEVKKQDL